MQAFRNVNPDDTSALEFVTFPTTDGNANNQAVLFPDATDGGRRAASGCVASTPSRLQKPWQPSDVRVKVLNGSGRAGVAQNVTQAARRRRASPRPGAATTSAVGSR